MGKLLSRLPKNFLPMAHLTGGFTLMAVGLGIICGLGVGLLSAGAFWVVGQTVAYSKERGAHGQNPDGPPSRLP